MASSKKTTIYVKVQKKEVKSTSSPYVHTPRNVVVPQGFKSKPYKGSW